MPRDLDMSQFVMRRDNDPVKSTQPSNGAPLDESHNYGRVAKYTPPDPKKNLFDEKAAAQRIPAAEQESIKKTARKRKKTVEIPKDRRDPVRKISVSCCVCGGSEEFYEGAIIMGGDLEHICAKCIRKGR